MLNVNYTPFASTAAETVVTLARRNVEAFDQVASAAKGTPVAPLFEIASKFQHTALEGLEAMTDVFEAQVVKPSKTASAKSAKSIEKVVKPAAEAAKKAVDAQADLMAEAGAEMVKASSQAAGAVKKATKSAESADAVELYEDLTAITGIGPATMRKLQDAGIRSISDLATISTKALTEIIEQADIRILRYSPEDLIANAKSIMKKAA